MGCIDYQGDIFEDLAAVVIGTLVGALQADVVPAHAPEGDLGFSRIAAAIAVGGQVGRIRACGGPLPDRKASARIDLPVGSDGVGKAPAVLVPRGIRCQKVKAVAAVGRKDLGGIAALGEDEGVAGKVAVDIDVSNDAEGRRGRRRIVVMIPASRAPPKAAIKASSR